MAMAGGSGRTAALRRRMTMARLSAQIPSPVTTRQYVLP